MSPRRLFAIVLAVIAIVFIEYLAGSEIGEFLANLGIEV